MRRNRTEPKGINHPRTALLRTPMLSSSEGGIMLNSPYTFKYARNLQLKQGPWVFTRSWLNGLAGLFHRMTGGLPLDPLRKILE